MENEKIKSRPGKVMENEYLAKGFEKVMEFLFFTNISHVSFRKNVLITYTFDTQ